MSIELGAALASLSWAAVLAGTAHAGAHATTTQGADGRQLVTMENRFVRLAIDPSRGGRVASFVYKPAGTADWVTKAPTAGMFLDHVWQQAWPGALMDAPYQHEIVSRGPDVARVRCWRTIDSGEGKDTVWGVRYERVLTLHSDRPTVGCTIRLTNTTQAPRSPGLWVQHVVSVGGPKATNVYARPSIHGIDRAQNRFVGPQLAVKTQGHQWVKQPVAGWTAAVDPDKHIALVQLVDYNYLRWLYNCTGVWSVEVMYDQVVLPPGKTWQTELSLIPVQGLTDVVHASHAVVADLRGDWDGDRLKVASAVASVDRLREASLVLQGRSLHGKTALGEKRLALGELGRSPVRHEFVWPVGAEAGSEGVVIHAQLLAAGDVHERYEVFVPPRQATDPARARQQYVRPAPPKRKQYFKPARLARVPHKGLAVLECRGMWFRPWGVGSAVRSLPDARLSCAYHQRNVYGDRLSTFVADYDALLRLDVIVLTNVTAESLGDTGREMVKDFVEAGGGLLVLGGRFCLAGGAYRGTQLEALLPVQIGKPFDVKPAETPLVLRAGTPSPITAGLRWDRRSVVRFYQKVAGLAPGAQVLVHAGSEPMLVTRRVGKGRVAIVAASVEGKPQGAQPLFYQWQDWPRLMTRLLQWLKG